MAIRNLPNTDGLPAFEVDTAEELTELLIPGVYVRASRAVLAECGLTALPAHRRPPEGAGARPARPRALAPLRLDAQLNVYR